MSIAEVIAQVPAESGIWFVSCPTCNGGVQEGFWNFNFYLFVKNNMVPSCKISTELKIQN